MGARAWVWIVALPLLGGCAASDCSAGVGGFAKAVAAQDEAEHALIGRADDARKRQWLDRVAGAPAAHVGVDLPRCEAPTGYRPGDCRVVSDLSGPTPRPTTSSTRSLSVYATALAAVATDAGCAAVSSDAASLSASIGSMAAALHASGGTAASPFVALAGVGACRALAAYRLDVLRRATAAADPVIQRLVAPTQDKDRMLARLVVRDAAAAVDTAAVAYQAAPSRAALQALVDRTAAVDAAQQVSLDRSMAEVASLHARLRGDLEARRPDLARVMAEARAIVDEAEAAKAALDTPPAAEDP